MSQLNILLVLAIGKPQGHAVMEAVGSDGNMHNWRDAKESHYY